MEIYRENNLLDGFNLAEEFDPVYNPDPNPELEAIAKLEKLVVNGDSEARVLEDCSYVWVDEQYSGELSPGQRQTYELLLSLQRSSLYAVTSIGKLCEAQGLTTPWPCLARLDNLQSLGAISGLKR